MEWIETYKKEVYDGTNTTEWIDYTLVWNGFILVKMTVNAGKVYVFTESIKKYDDRQFSFMRLFLGREDIDQVKEEIINLFK
jgi:hypothetical protein